MVVKNLALEPGSPAFNPGFATFRLCELGQVVPSL